jgi:hypothetical protein
MSRGVFMTSTITATGHSMDELFELSSDRDAVRGAIAELQRARVQLDVYGPAALAGVRARLERVLARLEPVTADEEVPVALRRAVERCRAALSSHLLAAENLEAVGVAPGQVAALLRRATATEEMETTVDDLGLHYARH